MHSHRKDRYRRICALSSILLFLAINVWAGQQRPEFRTAVARVRVDVILTDSEGRFIEDLGPEDFEVFEDGKPQDVLSVQLIDAESLRVLDLPQSRVEPTGPGGDKPAKESVFEATEGGARESDSTILEAGAVVFLIDFPSLDWRTKFAFAEAWKALMAQNVELRLPHAVYAIDQNGRLREMAPLTTDVGTIREAIEQILDMPLALDRVKNRFVRDAWKIQRGVECLRSLYKFRLLAALADTLAGRGRRTALVWVASAVAHTCGSELAPPDSRVLSAQRRFHEAANSANVAVYAVDPSARIDLDVQVADASIPMGFLPGGVRAAGADGSMMLQAIARQRRILAQLRDALFNAADETSGRAFVAWAELAEVLGEIREDSRRYYLLTYAAPPPMEDGDYHEIRVKVRRDGARVRARKGYVDYGRDERRERSIETASAFPGLADGPTVWLRAHRIWTSKSQPRVVLVASVDPYELGRVYEANGEASISLELRASAADENGVELVAELTDEVRLSVADVGSGPLVRRYAWNVAPGRYGLHVLVVDRATDRVGTASVEIEVPDRSSADWFVSDPILLARENEPEGQLLVADHVIVGKPLAAYLEVYGGEEPVLGGWVESALGAAPLELSPIRMRRGADGISRASLSVPAPFSGRYTIHLWVRDARANQHWSFALPIEAVPTGGAF